MVIQTKISIFTNKQIKIYFWGHLAFRIWELTKHIRMNNYL